MINLKEQIELFKLIGSELGIKTECLVVGGTAMLFYGAKETTKDVDIITMDEQSFDAIKKALENIGFAERNLFTIFKHYELIELVKKDKRKPVIMESKDIRMDLFCREIICFKVSDSMLERVREVHELNNLIVKIMSPEDIILLKCATEREKDRLDALELIKKFNINWSIVIKESIHQTEIGEDVFPVYLYDFLMGLKEDLKADIPDYVIKEIRKIGEKAMEKVLIKRKMLNKRPKAKRG